MWQSFQGHLELCVAMHWLKKNQMPSSTFEDKLSIDERDLQVYLRQNIDVDVRTCIADQGTHLIVLVCARKTVQKHLTMLKCFLILFFESPSFTRRVNLAQCSPFVNVKFCHECFV